MALLSFDEILAASDIEEEAVPVPEWGGEVKVRGLTRKQVKDVQRVATKRTKDGLQVLPDLWDKGLVFYGMVHPSIDDAKYELLMGKSAGPIQRIVDKIMELSHMASDEEEAEEGLKKEEGSFPARSDSDVGVPDSGGSGEDES